MLLHKLMGHIMFGDALCSYISVKVCCTLGLAGKIHVFKYMKLIDIFDLMQTVN